MRKSTKRMLLVLFMLPAFFSAPETHAISRPEIPTGAASKVPDLLTEYERRYLRIELRNLMREISIAREECGEDPSLAELKAEPQRLSLRGAGAAEVNAAMQKYSDAREALLYKREGIPEKIKRLQEVGAYLEYDLRRKKEERAKTPQVQFQSAKSEKAEAASE
ncbi:MAG: hypothetical protein ACI4QT_05110 [Kiritimatiellia bacterium]